MANKRRSQGGRGATRPRYKEGWTFPLTKSLRTLLEAEHVERECLQRQGHAVPCVFFRMVAKKRRGPRFSPADHLVRQAVQISRKIDYKIYQRYKEIGAKEYTFQNWRRRRI